MWQIWATSRTNSEKEVYCFLSSLLYKTCQIQPDVVWGGKPIWAATTYPDCTEGHRDLDDIEIVGQQTLVGKALEIHSKGLATVHASLVLKLGMRTSLRIHKGIARSNRSATAHPWIRCPVGKAHHRARHQHRRRPSPHRRRHPHRRLHRPSRRRRLPRYP